MYCLVLATVSLIHLTTELLERSMCSHQHNSDIICIIIVDHAHLFFLHLSCCVCNNNAEHDLSSCQKYMTTTQVQRPRRTQLVTVEVYFGCP